MLAREGGEIKTGLHSQKMRWMYGPQGVLEPDFPKAQRPPEGERVRVHMNLNKKCFSLSRYFKPNGTWYVTHHTPRVLLRDCEMRVSEAGRQRTIREGVRNVHAYVYGEFVEMGYLVGDAEGAVGFCLCKYNPYKCDAFYLDVDTLGEDARINRCRWFVGTEKHVMVFPHGKGDMYVA